MAKQVKRFKKGDFVRVISKENDKHDYMTEDSLGIGEVYVVDMLMTFRAHWGIKLLNKKYFHRASNFELVEVPKKDLDLNKLLRCMKDYQKSELLMRLNLVSRIEFELSRLKISKEEFKKEFGCTNDFILGSVNYSIKQIAEVETYLEKKRDLSLVKIPLGRK